MPPLSSDIGLYDFLNSTACVDTSGYPELIIENIIALHSWNEVE